MNENSPTRLLLVDDEAALREPLADYLVRQGFAVVQAGSAAEARAQLAEVERVPMRPSTSSCSTS